MTDTPTLLAFDTSGPHCAAALLAGDTIVTRIDDMARGQAEHLMPMLEEMLREAGLSFRDLDGIGVGIGPGNFTGIRISVSAARGLALGLGKPAIGVSTLEALAFDGPRPALTVLDARQERLYAQLFTSDGTQNTPALLALDETELRALVGDKTPTLIGPMAEQGAALTGWAVAEAARPLSEAILHLAAERLGTPAASPAPLYLRPADAAPARDTAPVLLD